MVRVQDQSLYLIANTDDIIGLQAASSNTAGGL
jgi:hypothetical protein